MPSAIQFTSGFLEDTLSCRLSALIVGLWRQLCTTTTQSQPCTCTWQQPFDAHTITALHM